MTLGAGASRFRQQSLKLAPQRRATSFVLFVALAAAIGGLAPPVRAAPTSPVRAGSDGSVEHHPDKIYCKIGAPVLVHLDRIQVPNTLTIHGQDMGMANGACVDTGVLDPRAFTAFLDANLQFKDSEGDWETYDVDTCLKPSFLGHAVIAQCTVGHDFEDPNDPILDEDPRCVLFQLGILVNGQKDVRDERRVCPVTP